MVCICKGTPQIRHFIMIINYVCHIIQIVLTIIFLNITRHVQRINETLTDKKSTHPHGQMLIANNIPSDKIIIQPSKVGVFDIVQCLEISICLYFTFMHDSKACAMPNAIHNPVKFFAVKSIIF